MLGLHSKLRFHLQVTASGDQMARLWDIKSGELLGSFKGHLCSLKSVAIAPQETGTESKHVFTAATRDANSLIVSRLTVSDD